MSARAFSVSFRGVGPHADSLREGFADPSSSQEVLDVFGGHGLGHIIYYLVLLATILILYTGGNTSFNGFPFSRTTLRR